MRHHVRVSLFSLLIAIAPAAAGAQVARGVVSDSASGRGIAGAVISALAAGGRTTARTVANSDGRYHLSVAGAATLQVLHIGFRPRRIELHVAPSDSAVVIDVRMQNLPALLEAMQVTDHSLCAGSPQSSDALALWDQARAGLLATVVARETYPAHVETFTYERALNPRTKEIERQVVHRSAGVSSRPVLAAHDAATFAVHGYVFTQPGGDVFEAPDADVLLDPTFASTHCFDVRRDREHSGQIGLGFKPAERSRPIIDVEGVLWIDAEHPALRSLEFSYTNLAGTSDAGSGGSLSFREMRPGLVFIDGWDIRIASVEQEPTVPIANRNSSSAPRSRVTALSDRGGALVAARWDDGVYWHGVFPRIEGHVVERDTHAPAQGVRVWLADQADTVSTAADGGFAFDPLLPGPYRVVVGDSSLVHFGIVELRTADVRLGATDTARVSIDWTSLDARILHVCDGQSQLPGRGVILGRVIDAHGAPVPGIDVLIHPRTELEEKVPDTQVLFSGNDRTANTGSAGQFYVCNAQPRETTLLRIHLGADHDLTEKAALADGERYTFVVLRLPPPAAK